MKEDMVIDPKIDAIKRALDMCEPDPEDLIVAIPEQQLTPEEEDEWYEAKRQEMELRTNAKVLARYDAASSEWEDRYVDNGQKERDDVTKFLREIADVCQRHGFSLGHEDGHGAFLVERWNLIDEEWLLEARDNTRD
jgi:hypothetical protein